MAAVGGKEGYIELSREFHLDGGQPLQRVIKTKVRNTYGLRNIALSAGDNNDADGGSLV